MCTYTPTSAAANGDTHYSPLAINQPFIDWAWGAFDLDKDDWIGWGYDNVGDTNTPLNRLLSGMWCLVYSAGAPSTDRSQSILTWGWDYARKKIDEVDGECGSSIAYTRYGPFIDNYTSVYQAFFDQSVPARASTLVHEARHADWKGHDAGDKDSDWDYNGAYRWEVCWLSWFVHHAQHAPAIMKTAARQEANRILASSFVKPPGFTV